MNVCIWLYTYLAELFIYWERFIIFQLRWTRSKRWPVKQCTSHVTWQYTIQRIMSRWFCGIDRTKELQCTGICPYFHTLCNRVHHVLVPPRQKLQTAGIHSFTLPDETTTRENHTISYFTHILIFSLVATFIEIGFEIKYNSHHGC